MALSVKRQVANPDIAIRDLMQVFQTYVVQCNSFDLLDLLDCPGHCHWSWKTAPNPSWMCKLHRLVVQLLGLAPNGVLPSAKVRLAIAKLSELMKINHGRFNTATFADNCDQRLRVVMAQYRFVKQHPHEYQRLMKKTTPEEKACIDRALNLLALEPSTPSTASTTGIFGAGSSQLALVPYVGGGHKTSSPKDIFSKILTKQVSSPDEKKANFFHDSLHTEEPRNRSHASATASPAKLKRKNAFFFPGAGGFCVPGDETPGSEHLNITPVKAKEKEDKKTGKDIASKAKTTLASTICKEDLSGDDLELVEEALGSTISVSKGKKMSKKPAGGKAVAKKEKKQKGKIAGKPKQTKDKKKKGNSNGPKKTTFRHRATSTAYHSAKNQALQRGQSPESARAAGRRGHRQWYPERPRCHYMKF